MKSSEYKDKINNCIRSARTGIEIADRLMKEASSKHRNWAMATDGYRSYTMRNLEQLMEEADDFIVRWQSVCEEAKESETFFMYKKHIQGKEA